MPADLLHAASHVALQRPNKAARRLPRVMVRAPSSTTTTARRCSPLRARRQPFVAVADAPDTVDAMLRAAFEQAAIYISLSPDPSSSPIRMKTISDNPERSPSSSEKVGRRFGGVDDRHRQVRGPANACTAPALGWAATTGCRACARAIFIDDPSRYRHTVKPSRTLAARPAGRRPTPLTSAALAGARRIGLRPAARRAARQSRQEVTDRRAR